MFSAQNYAVKVRLMKPFKLTLALLVPKLIAHQLHPDLVVVELGATLGLSPVNVISGDASGERRIADRRHLVGVQMRHTPSYSCKEFESLGPFGDLCATTLVSILCLMYSLTPLTCLLKRSSLCNDCTHRKQVGVDLVTGVGPVEDESASLGDTKRRKLQRHPVSRRAHNLLIGSQVDDEGLDLLLRVHLHLLDYLRLHLRPLSVTCLSRGHDTLLQTTRIPLVFRKTFSGEPHDPNASLTTRTSAFLHAGTTPVTTQSSSSSLCMTISGTRTGANPLQTCHHWMASNATAVAILSVA